VADARALPLPAACVDLTVTSPPYALDIGYIGGDVQAETWPDFMAAWLAEALRVTRPHGRLALNVPLDTSKGGKRPTYVQACQAALDVGWSYQATITWHEGHTSKGDRALGTVNSSRRPHPIDASEMIVLLSKGAWGPSSGNPDDITPAEWQLYGRSPWRFPGVPRRPGGHPAPFPEELPYRLIRYLSRVGDVVCDPFVGSGTTSTVAHRLGRVALGFDLAPAYAAMARRRVLGTHGNADVI
jgi:site-specific DNA-methyltransferase (adenine-specific)